MVGALHDYELKLLERRIGMVTNESSAIFKEFYSIPFLRDVVQDMTYSMCNEENQHLYR